MTYLVPFDGSPLSVAALRRAVEFADGVPVVAYTVVPRDRRYAASKGWLAADTPFDEEAVRSSLSTQVAEVSADARFVYDLIPAHPSPGVISKHIREAARDHGATVLFIGSENAGRIVVPVASVGAHSATDTGYDVFIVRYANGP